MERAGEGEGRLILEQIREMTRDLLSALTEIDDQLAVLQGSVKSQDKVDKEALLLELRAIRKRISNMEKEDTEELKEERILENMIKKLNDLIELTIG